MHALCALRGVKNRQNDIYYMNLETIIGLEIHVQLKTKTKMFCGCSNDGENQPPNTTVCEICLGHPGVLPVPNKEAFTGAIRAAIAIGCEINEQQQFDRKNYFYPDLPKGYQISQLDHPVGEHGALDIKVPMSAQQARADGEMKRFGITRLHLEEDAAKNTHLGNKIQVDYNRGGTPLMEIVTEPDFRSPQEAKAFLQELRLIMRYLGASDADMEKGHLRCDANISMRPVGEEKLYPKTELKNLNSFKAVERALEYETLRQSKLWEAATPPDTQATRGWDENKQITLAQRTKETSDDYRYFPEPDIAPVNLSLNESIDLDEIKRSLPELPAQKRARFKEEYELSVENAHVLVEDKYLAEYFEQCVSELKSWLESSEEGSSDEIWEAHKKKLSKLVSNWLINKLGALVLEHKLNWETIKITPENFAEFISLIHYRKVSSTAAQTVLARMLETGEDPSHILEDEALEQVSDSGQLAGIVDKVIADNPEEVARYKEGKTALIQFFLGQVMRETKGKANPQTIQELMEQKLAE